MPARSATHPFRIKRVRKGEQSDQPRQYRHAPSASLPPPRDRSPPTQTHCPEICLCRDAAAYNVLMRRQCDPVGPAQCSRRAAHPMPQRRPGAGGSHLTLRWREPDSNHRSRSWERLFWALPIGHGGTKGGATYRFRSKPPCLPGVAAHSLSLRGGTASSSPSPSNGRVMALGRALGDALWSEEGYIGVVGSTVVQRCRIG
jgi:hypothetical protein